MATKMLFVCNCGALFPIGDSGDMTTHLDVHTDHVITEATVHESTTPSTLVTVQDSLVLQIRTKRDGDRLENQIRAEYPPGSGKLWRCSQQSQSDWSSLVSLDSRGLVAYPFRAWTYDERAHHDIVNAADLSAIVGTVAAAVLAERANAQTFADAVLAATDEASAQAAADPYLNL